VLENGEFQRVGETQERSLPFPGDCRHQSRPAARKSGREFPGRLVSIGCRCFTIEVPSLREMDEDRTLLLEHYRKFYAGQAKLPPFALDDAAQKAWRDYHFPGNVRELRNVVIPADHQVRWPEAVTPRNSSPSSIWKRRPTGDPDCSRDPDAHRAAQRHLQRERSFKSRRDAQGLGTGLHSRRR